MHMEMTLHKFIWQKFENWIVFNVGREAEIPGACWAECRLRQSSWNSTWYILVKLDAT